jgi:hypothetical protein
MLLVGVCEGSITRESALRSGAPPVLLLGCCMPWAPSPAAGGVWRAAGPLPLLLLARGGPPPPTLVTPPGYLQIRVYLR